MATSIVLIIIYAILAFLTYFFIKKRLRFLNERHIIQTGATGLRRYNVILLRIITVIFIICFAGGVVIILTFN